MSAGAEYCGRRQGGTNACGEPCGPLSGMCGVGQQCTTSGMCECMDPCGIRQCGFNACGQACGGSGGACTNNLTCASGRCVGCGNGVIEPDRNEECEVGVGTWSVSNCVDCRSHTYNHCIQQQQPPTC